MELGLIGLIDSQPIGGTVFRKEVAELREIESEVRSLQEQIDNLSLALKRLADQIADQKRQVLKSEKQLGGLPATLDEELQQAQELYQKRKALQAEVLEQEQSQKPSSQTAALRLKLTKINLEIDIKNSLIRGMQGKYPLDGRAPIRRSFQRGVYFTVSHPRLVKQLEKTKLLVDKGKLDLSELRISLGKMRRRHSHRLSSLEKALLALQQPREFFPLGVVDNLSSELSGAYVRWVQMDLHPAGGNVLEYLERRVPQLSISKTYFDGYLAELDVPKKNLVRLLQDAASPKLDKEATEAFLIFLKRDNETLLRRLISRLLRKTL